MKRVIIVHGWGGHPHEGWFPWLKKVLEEKEYHVDVPEMPDTDHPKIDTWVGKLKEVVGTPDKDTILVGHSIGCQTIMRYLETVDEIGGAVLVAGFFHLTKEGLEEEGAAEIAKPWLETPIDTDKLRKFKIVGIFSDDDPHVPIDDAQLFMQRLNAKIVIEGKKGHLGGEDKVFELQSVLDAVITF